MNPTLLIDAIVRQTMVLIATLATSSGQRAPLAHLANRVFAELVRELREQGIGNRVIADMFGMALRTYHTHVARQTASRTDTGRSLWEGVLSHVQDQGPLLREEILARFANDEEATVRGVLHDLVESGLLERTGRGESTTYQSVQRTEESSPAPEHTLASLLLVAIHRNGPIARSELAKLVPTGSEAGLTKALDRLVAEGRAHLEPGADEELYRADTCVIPFGDPIGWEAAVFDHYQAMVAALVAKLRGGTRRAELADRTGGSTFVFDLWHGHQAEPEVLDFLKRVRQEGLALRAKLDAGGLPPEGAERLRVVSYVGQMLVEGEVYHG